MDLFFLLYLLIQLNHLYFLSLQVIGRLNISGQIFFHQEGYQEGTAKSGEITRLVQVRCVYYGITSISYIHPHFVGGYRTKQYLVSLSISNESYLK
jgi:hypothetical protein